MGFKKLRDKISYIKQKRAKWRACAAQSNMFGWYMPYWTHATRSIESKANQPFLFLLLDVLFPALSVSWWCSHPPLPRLPSTPPGRRTRRERWTKMEEAGHRGGNKLDAPPLLGWCCLQYSHEEKCSNKERNSPHKKLKKVTRSKKGGWVCGGGGGERRGHIMLLSRNWPWIQATSNITHSNKLSHSMWNHESFDTPLCLIGAHVPRKLYF